MPIDRRIEILQYRKNLLHYKDIMAFVIPVGPELWQSILPLKTQLFFMPVAVQARNDLMVFGMSYNGP